MRGNVRHPSVLSLSSLTVAVALALTACGGASSPDDIPVDAPAPTVPPATGTGTPGTPTVPGAPTTPAPPTTPNVPGVPTVPGTPGAPSAPIPPSAPATPAGLSGATHACAVMPAMPTKPANALLVTNFGARGDDGNDDSAAIEAAIRAAQPGQWIVFPSGRYIHNKSIKVNKAGVVLWSEGATLHGSNISDQAVMLEADGASVYNFTMTAVSDKRLTAPWQSRVAVIGGTNPRRLLRNNIVRNNKIVHAGERGTPLANSTSAAGIFIYNATNFLIAENTVSRSLADAIHITAGSYNGRVLKNTVREPGDDMIAVVSYIGSPSMAASQVNAEFAARRARDLVRNVLVSGNSVSGNYWGRGITVVGGESVTIENNRIERTTHAAGIYLARETSYLTFGVKDILVRNNVISQVQTTAPAYMPVGFNFRTTGHAGVEIYSHMFTDEKNYPTLVDGLAVENIRLENNTVDQVRTDGVRIGNGTGRTWGASGRTATGGRVGKIALANTRLSAIQAAPVSVLSQPSGTNNVLITGTTLNGGAYSNPASGGAAPAVSGAEVTCP